jgi:hypothetical protein
VVEKVRLDWPWSHAGIGSEDMRPWVAMVAVPDAGDSIERGEVYGDRAGYVDRRCGTE